MISDGLIIRASSSMEPLAPGSFQPHVHEGNGEAALVLHPEIVRLLRRHGYRHTEAFLSLLHDGRSAIAAVLKWSPGELETAVAELKNAIRLHVNAAFIEPDPPPHSPATGLVPSDANWRDQLGDRGIIVDIGLQ